MKVLAILIVIAGLVIAVAPQYTNCEAQGGTMPTATTTTSTTLSPMTTLVGQQTSVAATIVPKMKCLWSARGALAVGVSLAVAGALLFFARRKETRRALSIVGALLGLSAILLPTSLIGTCGSAGAVCNTTMKPIMLAAGGLAVAASVLVLVVNELKRDEVAGTGTDAGAG
jgi:hypothetical protein